jgi:hypothetical protein
MKKLILTVVLSCCITLTSSIANAQGGKRVADAEAVVEQTIDTTDTVTWMSRFEWLQEATNLLLITSEHIYKIFCIFHQIYEVLHPTAETEN